MNFLKTIKRSTFPIFPVIIFGLLIILLLKLPIKDIKIENASALTVDDSIIPSGISETLDLGTLTSTWRNLFINGFDVQDGKVNSINNFESINPGRGLMIIGGGFSDSVGNRLCYSYGNKVGICETHGLTCDSVLQFIQNGDGTLAGDYFKPCNVDPGDAYYFMCFCN